MTGEPTQVLVLEIVDRMLRSWWTVVAAVCLGLTVGMIGLSQLPVIYEAQAEIDLSSEKLPSEFFRDTVTGDEDQDLQLSVLQRTVLGESNLAKIVEQEYGETSRERREDLARQIGGAVRVSLPRWSESFVISFRDSDPNRAARIVNSLAEAFVREKVKFNVRGAQETVESLEHLVEVKSTDIKELRRRRVELRSKLPFESDPVAARERMTEAREGLARLQEERSGLEEQLEYLNVQYEFQGRVALTNIPDLDAQGGVLTGGGSPASGDISLATLEAELRELLNQGKTDSHPDVVKKRSLIDLYKSRVKKNPEQPDEDVAPAERPQIVSIWQVQIQMAERELESIRKKERSVANTIQRYERERIEIPQIRNQLEELDDELAILEPEYQSLRVRVEEAKTSESVEEQGRGALFQILNYAGVPRGPVSPKPSIVYGVAVAISLVVFVGPLLASALLFPVVASEARLASAVDLPLLVSMPTIPTAQSKKRSRLLLVKNLGLSVAAVFILATTAGLRLAGLI